MKQPWTGPHWRAIGGAVIAALLVYGLSRAGWSAPKPATAPQTVTVAPADITQTVQASGLLQPKVKVDIGAQLGGQIRKLHVQLGQRVKAGALLVTLDPDAAQNAVQQARAALAQQAATMKRTGVEMEAARLESRRQRRLLDGNATTAFERDQADTALAKFEAEYEGQQATLEQRRADLADKQLKLSYTHVHAPMDGEVVAIAVQEGQTVSALQASPTLLTLAQLGQMTVRARVAEAEVGLVQPGQAARLTTLSAQARRYEGRVQVIQPIPERIGNGLFYNVLFDIDNGDRQLLSDMTVQVDLEVARARQVPALPIVALDRRDGDGRYAVRVLGAQGQEATRHVRIGIRDEAHAQVLDGLQPGERVLLAPAAAASSAR